MKIMIIDDEPLVRIGMKSIIPWEQHGYSICGEAGSGAEAVRVAKETEPDILLVDIVIPEMDGLDFIEEVKDSLPWSKFIILSNREDVSFYKRAISLSVSEYIVKSSAHPEEILKSVNTVSKEIKRERVFSSGQKNSSYVIKDMVVLHEFINQVLQGAVSDNGIIREKLLLHDIVLDDCVLFVCTIHLQTNRELHQDGDPKLYSLMGILREIVRDVAKGMVLRSYEGAITCVIGLRLEDSIMDTMDYIASRMHETVFQVYDEHITIGVSDRIDKLHRIYNGYNQAKEAAKRIFFEEPGKTFYYSRRKADESGLTSEGHQHLQKILSISSFSEMDTVLTETEALIILLHRNEKLTPGEAREICLSIIYHILELARGVRLDVSDILKHPFEIVEGSKTFGDMMSGLKKIIISVNEKLEKRYADSTTRLVDGVNTYIEEHAENKIKLEDIAGYVNFSPSYISRIYKQKTGQTVRGRIIQVKVEKSKQMLLDGHTLAVITEKLDFSSESHFIKVFKELNGMTPGSFVKSMRSC